MIQLSRDFVTAMDEGRAERVGGGEEQTINGLFRGRQERP